ncbi:1-phosphofructokinase family hexose kinase [Lacticaseibacillus kribbianus]|uniref:1-phosphofructokinase family hexose kinase n=1 Tax=Lacticaseibacillus kribbianus TaxID=2926292 RepID=UPI001CD44309|nr:PfkB family carbohydrate kinase [Lacticaseibacillus kribbianus]
MLLTVTLNPAVDVHYRLAALQLDNVNRVANGIVSAGGNGINSARVLTQLGVPTQALGLAGGPRGAQLRRLMQADGVPSAFTPIAADTRQCLALLHGTAQTEVLEAGPAVTPAALAAQLQAPVLAAVPWVLVSLGADGAIARHGERLYRATVPRVAAVNAVGSGDATTAGIAVALTRGLDDRAALAWALACGTANAAQDATGSVDLAQVAALAARITVTALRKEDRNDA